MWHLECVESNARNRYYLAYPIDDGLSSPRSVLRAFVAALLAGEAVRDRVERAVAARRHLTVPRNSPERGTEN